MCVCVCVCVCVCERERERVCVCVPVVIIQITRVCVNVFVYMYVGLSVCGRVRLFERESTCILVITIKISNVCLCVYVHTHFLLLRPITSQQIAIPTLNTPTSRTHARPRTHELTHSCPHLHCRRHFQKEMTISASFECYGVATISRLLKIIGLFCRILSLL